MWVTACFKILKSIELKVLQFENCWQSFSEYVFVQTNDWTDLPSRLGFFLLLPFCKHEWLINVAQFGPCSCQTIFGCVIVEFLFSTLSLAVKKWQWNRFMFFCWYKAYITEILRKLHNLSFRTKWLHVFFWELLGHVV